MSYKVTLFTTNIFDNESINETFKSMGNVPQMNVEVDFHTDYLYKLFIKKIISEYISKVSPNICQLLANSETLHMIVKDNPDIDVNKYFKSLDSKTLTEKMTKKILPLPE